MKPQVLPFLLALTILARAQTPSADAGPPPAPGRDIAVELRCVVLPVDKAVPLVRKLRSTKAEEKSDGLKAMDDLLEKGVAKLAGWPFVITRDREKGTSEANEEIRYAVEFE